MAKERKTGRAQVGLRVSGDMQRRLERTAKKNGRSINSEIVERLKRSFETEDRVGGPRLAKMLESIGVAMNAAGENAPEYDNPDVLSNGRWVRRREAYQHAVKVAVAILEASTPPEEPMGALAEVLEDARHKARNRK